ncbi:MAG: DinB family protein, partial [Flavobacteriales bacterium]|nr:DinB family protein [Flavobacteriales bacterium]
MPPYLAGYVAKAEGNDLLHALQKASDTLWDTVYRIPTGMAGHRYAPDKWTIRELFQHLVDTERVFQYRALSFARGDTTPLPGFDENA